MMAAMRGGARHRTFIGRRRERESMAELIAAAREGRSAAVVVRAAAGAGKTYLLSRVVDDNGEGMHVVRISGTESEMVLEYAALQQLCAQLRPRVDSLPQVQQRALRVALGLDAGDRPDPFLVGLAVVNVLSDAGARRPLLCVVDDAHWVDEPSRQALGFAARRLLADRVALVFATRDTGDRDHLDGLRQLMLAPLTDAESRALLDAVLPGRLDDRVRERLLADAAGNPLALVELPDTRAPAQLAGGFGLAGGAAPPTTVEDVFGRRYLALPEPTRLLLLIAAAEPVGEPSWLWGAAESLGVGVDDAAAGETAGLMSLDTRVTFRHPLVRSAVYRGATAADRHRVHAALAAAITGPDAADHRAWHRAHASSAPSEPLAAELVDVTERARRRGGISAAAAFLAYAVDLTPDPDQRARRALAAATAALDAGDTAAAARLIDTAGAAVVDDRHHAHVALLRARLAFAADRGREGPRLLLAAAQALAGPEPLLSRDTYLEALMAAMIVGRLAAGDDHSAQRVAAAARDAPPAPTPARAVDQLLDALVTRLTEGHRAAAAQLKSALHAYLRDVHAGTADPRWHDVTNRICLDLYDFTEYRVLATRQLDMLRAAGELTVLPAALTTLAAVHILDGEFASGEALLDEAFIVSSATGAPPHRSGYALLAAHRGDDALWESTAGRTRADAADRGEGTEVTVALFAEAMRDNASSRHQQALDACRAGLGYDDIGLSACLLVETVEAAARQGESAEAQDAAAEIALRASGAAGESALGLAARAGALAGRGDADSVAADYEKAITHLERSPLTVYRARTHLAYGEWLRRNARAGEARTQLRLAHGICVRIGADGFARRAARELESAGGSVESRRRRYDVGLTPQERHISRLVRQGNSNAEIAEQLLISHRTVEWHLRNIYGKLGIGSRRELRAMQM
jgi:DNA-binding CsgD family transcriptional regulator